MKFSTIVSSHKNNHLDSVSVCVCDVGNHDTLKGNVATAEIRLIANCAEDSRNANPEQIYMVSNSALEKSSLNIFATDFNLKEIKDKPIMQNPTDLVNLAHPHGALFLSPADNDHS